MYRAIVKPRIPSRLMRLLVLAAGGLALSTAGFAAPALASAQASWTTRVFQLSYDGTGDVSYHAEGASGDAGCYLSVDGTDSYAFNQLWTVKIAFKSLGHGNYATKVTSVTHVDGPQGGAGAQGKSGLGGDQTVAPDAGSCTNADASDVGHFSCTAKNPLLIAVPNPQLKLVRNGRNLLAEGVAFADGFWTYSGSDTIPSDKLNGGCAVYNDTDLTFGAGIFIGSDSITKVAMPARELASLAVHHEVTAPVHFGKNTLHPKQTGCSANFGTPNKCVIHSQSLDGKFKLIRIK